MRAISLLLPFGRINRRWFCFTYLIYGAAISATTKTLSQQIKPESLAEIDWTSTTIGIPLIVLACAAWLSIVGIVNRLHDFDVGGLQLVILASAVAAPSIISRFMDVDAGIRNLIGIGMAAFAFLATIFVVLKCAMTRGDDGPNRFGEEP
ncbi:MAG: DUF805 domain-containing protein [Hyphomicrobium sp.]